MLIAAGFTVPEIQPLQLQSVTWQGIGVFAGLRGASELGDLDISSGVKELWDALLEAGARPVGCGSARGAPD